MSDVTDLGTTPNGAAQAVPSTGTDVIGSMNNLGSIPTLSEKVVVVQPPAEARKELDTAKEERHFSKKINEMNESRTSLARKLVELDSQAIHDIAAEDPKLAQRLLEEYDLGADTVEELAAMRENPNVKKEDIKKKVQEDTRLSGIEEALFNEKMKRLKLEHDDLEGDLAEEFKKVYSNATFKGKSETQMIAIARASLGEEPKERKVNNSALEILRAQEGFSTPPRQSGEITKRNIIPKESKSRYESAGVTEADMEKYLPVDIDKDIAYAYGHHGEEK